MSDVFISYASEDRETASRVAAALEANGWSVFWDRKTPSGKTWEQVLEEQLETTKCVVVLWSKASVDRHWVRSEASTGRERGVLVPATIENVEKIPYEFRRIQAADLTGWDGSDSHAEFAAFVQAIAEKAPVPDRTEELGKRGGLDPETGPRRIQLEQRIARNIEGLYLPEPEDRAVAAKVLGSIGPDASSAVPALIKALKDEDGFVRREAAKALGRIGPEAVPDLTEALRDNSEGVRWLAARALGAIGPEATEAVRALTEALKDKNEDVRVTAAEALGTIGSEATEAVRTLIERMQDKDAGVRLAAVRALGKGVAADETLIQGLLDNMTRDEDAGVREAAAAALGATEPSENAGEPELPEDAPDSQRTQRNSDEEAPPVGEPEPAQEEPKPRRDKVMWQSDAPARDDRLKRKPLAVMLAKRLRSMQKEDRSSSFLIHVDGPWGSGKTSILGFLKDELVKAEPGPEWTVVWFDAWRQSGVGPPWWALLASLRDEVGKSLNRRGRMKLWIGEIGARLKLAGWGYLLAVSLMLVFAGAVYALLRPTMELEKIGETVTALAAAAGTLWIGARVAARYLLWDSWGSAKGARDFEQSHTNPMEGLADHFGWLVRKVNKPVAFFIDDLDRCSAEYVIRLLDAVQTLVRDSANRHRRYKTKDRAKREKASHEPCFVVAADGGWIRTAYEKKYSDFSDAVAEPGRPLGYLFLDKLFQMTLRVPPLSSDRRATFLRGLLRSEETTEERREDIHREMEETKVLLDNATSDQAMLSALGKASLEVREQLAWMAVEKLVTDEAIEAREHRLESFDALLEPNPRAMKRFINVYSSELAVHAVYTEKPPDDGSIALWVILRTRWPELADYLQSNPEGTRHPDEAPGDIRDLLQREDVQHLLDFPDGGPLTAKLIALLAGPRNKARPVSPD